MYVCVYEQEKLLLASGKTGLAFLSDWNGRSNNRKMDHLVCFMPGALALGAYTGEAAYIDHQDALIVGCITVFHT
jgi:hypothetical protein